MINSSLWNGLPRIFNPIEKLVRILDGIALNPRLTKDFLLGSFGSIEKLVRILDGFALNPLFCDWPEIFYWVQGPVIEVAIPLH